MGIQQQIGHPPMPAVAQVLSRYCRLEIEAFIEVAIGLLDVIDGDPDCEADDRGGESLPVPEGWDRPVDDDTVDPDLEETDIEDAFALSAAALEYGSDGPGCPIGDPDYGIDDVAHDTSDDDREVEQLLHDVPMLPAFDHDRRSVGIVNLQSSFRANGGAVLSADSGKPYRSAFRWDCKELGSPT